MSINEDNEFKPQAKEPQEEVQVGEGEQFQVLPGNQEEEKDEILLTAPTVNPAKAKMSNRQNAAIEILQKIEKGCLGLVVTYYR